MYIIFQFEKLLAKMPNTKELIIPKAFTEMVRLLQSKDHKVIILFERNPTENLKTIFTLEPKPNEMLTEQELEATTRVIFDPNYKMHHIETYRLTKSDNMLDKLQAYFCFMNNKKITKEDIFIAAQDKFLFSAQDKIDSLEETLKNIDQGLYKLFCDNKYRFKIEYDKSLITTSNNNSQNKVPNDDIITERTGLLSLKNK